MSSERIREDFEFWANSTWPGIRMLRINLPGSPVDGEYEVSGIEAAWRGWQASRQSLEITLSPLWYDGHGQWQVVDTIKEASVMHIQDVVDSLEAAGVRVKR